MGSASGYSRTIVRQGDANVAGGRITSAGQSTVFANGRPVACAGARGTSDAECDCSGGCNRHCAGRWSSIVVGSRTVFVEGKQVLAEGDIDSCGHPRAAGSSDIYAG